MDPHLPKVAIVGRPNVGKSTLFNRLVGRRAAIVDDIPGVTRDRHYGKVEGKGPSFYAVDTGGFVPGVQENILSRAVRGQVFLALEEADAVVFVVDGRFGITPAEEEIGRLLHKAAIPVVLAVNKIDNPKEEPLVADFLALGFEKTLALSAERPAGIDDLLEALSPYLKQTQATLPLPTDVKLAIVGQPNVGKSTLLNQLIGEERALVHHEAGTTLDPLNIIIERGSKIFEFVDTAGIKRRRSTQGKVEKVGVLKALEAVRLSNLVLMMVDATQGMGAQDMKILGQALEYGKGVLIILNKWDLMAPGSKIKDLKEKIYRRFKRQEDIPVLALSARSGRGVKKLFDLIDRVHENYLRRIGTGELNRVFQKALRDHPPPAVSGKFLNLSYITQSREAPPRFVIFCNRPKLVPEAYLRYLERVFRKSFKFSGVPLQWALREKK